MVQGRRCTTWTSYSSTLSFDWRWNTPRRAHHPCSMAKPYVLWWPNWSPMARKLQSRMRYHSLHHWSWPSRMQTPRRQDKRLLRCMARSKIARAQQEHVEGCWGTSLQGSCLQQGRLGNVIHGTPWTKPSWFRKHFRIPHERNGKEQRSTTKGLYVRGWLESTWRLLQKPLSLITQNNSVLHNNILNPFRLS